MTNNNLPVSPADVDAAAVVIDQDYREYLELVRSIPRYEHVVNSDGTVEAVLVN